MDVLAYMMGTWAIGVMSGLLIGWLKWGAHLQDQTQSRLNDAAAHGK